MGPSLGNEKNNSIPELDTPRTKWSAEAGRRNDPHCNCKNTSYTLPTRSYLRPGDGAGWPRLASALLRRLGGARDARKVVVHPLLLHRELPRPRPQRLWQRAYGYEGQGKQCIAWIGRLTTAQGNTWRHPR